MDWGHYAGQVLLREGAVKVKYLPILLSTSLLSIMMIISIFQSKIYGESKHEIYPDTIRENFKYYFADFVRKGGTSTIQQFSLSLSPHTSIKPSAVSCFVSVFR